MGSCRAIGRRIARRATISKPIGPHTLRHVFITAALDAGVRLQDVQEAASHADPRMTMRYDRAACGRAGDAGFPSGLVLAFGLAAARTLLPARGAAK